MTWLGGGGGNIGIMYMGTGGMLVGCAFMLLVVYLIKPRKMGDEALVKKDN